MRRGWWWVTAMLLCVHPARAASETFAKVVDAYYAEYSRHRPVDATELGIHDHDGDLEDLSRTGVAREVKRLKAWQQRVEAAPTANVAEASDKRLLAASIEARLLDLERIESWRHRADLYPAAATNSIYVLIKRDFAPLAVRLRSVIARESKIPKLLAAGRKNLTQVPRVWLDIALAQTEGLLSFFKTDVPEAFRAIEDRALRASFLRANEDVMRAIREYDKHLRDVVSKRAIAQFALGEELFLRKLATEEMVTTPIPELLARGEAEIARLQADFKKTAARIDAKKSYVEVQAEMSKDHPAAAELIAETKSRLAGLRKFLIDREIVTVPSEVMPRVEETPPFMRATTFASMFTPGPFEKSATEAYYNVTLPEASWPPERTESFLASVFNRSLIDIVSIHEAFPGHYVQFLWLPKITSKVRKYEGASSNSEGWAHYCEQMTLDEGYGAGNDKLRLAQLQDALLRAARYIVGIRMHTRGMTFEEGVAYFQREGLQSAEVALMETKRGTKDPTYLVYTLGKLEILKLRDEYKKKLGAAYTLKKFHDAFLAEGFAPLSLVRESLLRE